MDLGAIFAAGAAVFGTIFLAEIVDRSNLALMSLSSQGDARQIWLGAGAAFLVSTSLVVVLGALLFQALSGFLFEVRLAGGLLIVGYALLTLLRPARDESHQPPAAPAERGSLQAHPIYAAFLVVLLLEMGDNTQVLTLLFTASLADPLLVFLAALLGLLSASALGTRLGKWLAERVEARRLQVVFGGVLLIVGGFTILLAFFPGLLPYPG